MARGRIDRLRVTALSHRRAFFVEVMGRDCGYLALMAGIAGGAEAEAFLRDGFRHVCWINHHLEQVGASPATLPLDSPRTCLAQAAWTR